MDHILEAVTEQLPKFNKKLLKDFRREELDRSPEYISMVFKEAIKLFNGTIEYLGYRVLTPEERTNYEISRGLVDIQRSEWILVEYEFKFEGVSYTSLSYLPYMKNNYIVIRNTIYNVMLSITDRVFTKIRNGITCKVIRLPINFWRDKTYIMESVTSKEVYFETIITTKVHYKAMRKRKNQIYPTVIHYLLVKYDLVTMLDIFGIKEEEALFTDKIDETNTDQYEYFTAKAKTRAKSELYLRVDKKLLKSTNVKQRRVIASILYLLVNFKKHTVSDLYDKSCTIYKIMLGKLIHGMTTVDTMALNYMDNHLSTLGSYLDPITQKRLSDMDIFVHDTYGLFIYVFWHIDEMMLESHSDLYNKRIDVLDGLLVPTIVKSIYHQFYSFESRKNTKAKQISNLFRLVPKRISELYKLDMVRAAPARYNDNWLLSSGGKKVRTGVGNAKSSLNAPEQRFHPSFAVVESPVAFSQNNPGIGGTINPFVETESDGSIVKPTWAEKLDELLSFLPHK